MARLDVFSSAVFCRRLARLLNGNLSELNALEIMEEQGGSRQLCRVVARIITEMKRGEPFSEGAYISGAFDPCFLRCVKEAEENSRLKECLEGYEAFYREEARREQLKSGAVYEPLFALCIAAFMFILIIMFIYPHFIAMFNDVNIRMPAITSFIRSLSQVLLDYREIFILILAAVVIAVNIVKNSQLFRRWESAVIMGSELFGRIKRYVLYSGSARLLSLLRNENIPEDEVLGTLAEYYARDVYYSELLYKAAENMQGGARLSSVLRENGVFPSSFTEMLALGEELGDVNGYLKENAVFYLEEAERLAEKRLRVWQPLFILFVAVLLLLMITSLTAPIMTLFDEVSSI